MTLLHQFPEKLAVLSLGAGSDVPSWAESSSILSVTATATETAVLTAGRNVPSKVPGVRGLVAFVTADPGDASTAGLLVDLLAPLAEADVAVQVTTTSTVVWVLVDNADVDRAVEAWTARGHTVEPAPTEHPTPEPRRERTK